MYDTDILFCHSIRIALFTDQLKNTKNPSHNRYFINIHYRDTIGCKYQMQQNYFYYKVPVPRKFSTTSTLS